MDEIFLWQKLSTRSRRAMLRVRKKRGGVPHVYNPQGRLLKRLSDETGLDTEAVYNQILKERMILLKLRGIE